MRSLSWRSVSVLSRSWQEKGSELDPECHQGLPLTPPPPPESYQSLLISTPTFDNGTACLESQLPGVVLGVLGGPTAGTMCWSLSIGVTLNAFLTSLSLSSFHGLNGD